MLRSKVFLTVLLLVTTNSFATVVYDDADLSDSLTGWDAGGPAEPSAVLNSTDVQAGDYSLQMSDTPASGTTIYLSKEFTGSEVFTRNDLISLSFNFKITTSDSDYGIQVLLQDENYSNLASWSTWGKSGNVDNYWTTDFTEAEKLTWGAGKEDIPVVYLRVQAAYIAGSSAILVDNMNITKVPEPVSMYLLAAGACGICARRIKRK